MTSQKVDYWDKSFSSKDFVPSKRSFLRQAAINTALKASAQDQENGADKGQEQPDWKDIVKVGKILSESIDSDDIWNLA